MSAVPNVVRPGSTPYASNTLDSVASTSLRMSREPVADDEQEKSADDDENARAAKQRLAALVLITADDAMAQDLTGASRETIVIKEILGIAVE